MSGTFPCPLITIQPSRGLVDEKLQIIVKHLSPVEKVTLRALHQSEDNDLWEAFGYYLSDAKGQVSVAEDVSVGGSYKGRDPMGLLWSMCPAPGSRTGLRLRKKDVCAPIVVHVSVYRGHVSQGFQAQTALATAVAERWYMAPGVHRIDVREGGVRGTLFLPPGPGPFPGILDLWGGGGGLVEYRSALLASHGFISMVLEYPSPEEGRSFDVGFGYFETAFKILLNHPLVARDRVALFGLCFGSIVSLSLVAYSEVVQPRCCVCVSGSHTFSLKNSFSLPLKEACIVENQVVMREMTLPMTGDPALKVEVGRIKCPMLLVVGEDDQNVAAVECAEDMKRMMEKAGNGHLLATISYPGAGHLIEPPYTPHFRASNFIFKDTGRKVVMLWGGHTKPHSDAQEDSWKKILEFLQQKLYCNQDSRTLSKL